MLNPLRFLCSLCASAVQMLFLSFLCVLVVKSFAFGAAAMHKLHSGGITGAIRCKCANSAPYSLTPADTKCQFSGITGASRPPFQRKICEICKLCSE
jgi:hypothetical protein